MPVYVNQYQVPIGVFNNHGFITTKKSFYVTETNSEKNVFTFLSHYYSGFIFFLFMFTAYFHQKYRNNRFKSIVLPLLVAIFVNNSSNLERFSSLQNKLISLIKTSKQEYFLKIVKKLFDPSISSKTYWSILKSFLRVKRFLVFLLFFVKTNLLLTSGKRLSYLILSLPSNTH